MNSGFSANGMARIRSTVTRSISPENPTGAKGAGAMSVPTSPTQGARELGKGWKVSPRIMIEPGETAIIGDIEGSGVIRHIWLTTPPAFWRRLILRAYWDNDENPAIEVPLGDFFGQGWCEFAQVSSLPIATNPHGGFNSYWEMPFQSHARLTVENIGPETSMLFFQIDYELEPVEADQGYLHTQWRRNNPLEYQQPHVILDNAEGPGHYVGTYIAWGVNNSGWWGEGELKFYLDGDSEFPTICGTGTEDYFGGAFNFDVPGTGYVAFTTPFLGLHQILRPDGLYRSQQRFGMYRWHLPDPVRFSTDLRATIQALGWRSGRRFLPLQDDISSTAFWYSAIPGGKPESVFDPNHLEVA